MGGVRQKILPRVIFDHSPLVLKCGSWDKKSSSFKFENLWLKVDGLFDLKSGWWNEMVVVGCPDCKLIRNFKQKLEVWSKATFGEQVSWKNSLLNEFTELDSIQDDRILTEDEMMIVVVELEELVMNEEASWRQRSESFG